MSTRTMRRLNEDKFLNELSMKNEEEQSDSEEDEVIETRKPKYSFSMVQKKISFEG